jgi:hypothetical protein
MVIQSGEFPAGKNFKISITPKGAGMTVKVTNIKTGGWVEGMHWYTSMSTFKEKIVEMASLLGGGYHDQASVRAVIGKIVGR